MRALLVLATGLLATAPFAAAEATALFEDAKGDVGPWPTWFLGRGLPAPEDADLLAAALDGDVLTLTVASLPSELPRDRVWFAGWALDDGAYVGLGFLAGEGAAVCRWASLGEYGPEGEPTCEATDGAFAAGSPGAFTFAVPEDVLVGGKSDVGGAVVLLPDETAKPLHVLHFTGATVLDVAWGDDVPAPADDAAERVETASAALGTRDAPGAGPAALLAIAGLAATASRHRRW